MGLRGLMVGAVVAGVCGAAAGIGRAQSVEFRIVEREGQSGVASPFGAMATSDNVLNFAVQARVVGGSATEFLAEFAFDIVGTGEPDSSGTLAKLLVSNADGTYAANPGQTTSTIVGRGGLSAIYAALAMQNATFNGVVNTSSGTFTNTAGAQEIGLISGSASGAPLLLLTDLNQDGNPDTYPGSGTIAPMSPSVASAYLGAGGNFVDVYRFKYTTSVATARTITFHLSGIGVRTASDLVLLNGTWRARNPLVRASSASQIQIAVSSTGACCIATTGTCLNTTATLCTGANVFLAGEACAALPCPTPGRCCFGTSCTVVLESACAGTFDAGAGCSPNLCPGACCTGALCRIANASECSRTSGLFRGPGTVCGTVGNPTACCRANFDQTSGVTVQDIFGFLAGWFTGDPQTDFDDSGTINVQDIFGFLGAWFAGCG